MSKHLAKLFELAAISLSSDKGEEETLRRGFKLNNIVLDRHEQKYPDKKRSEEDIYKIAEWCSTYVENYSDLPTTETIDVFLETL